MTEQTEKRETISKAYSYKLVVKSVLVVSIGAVLSAFLVYYYFSRGPGTSYGESYAIFAGLRDQLLYRSAIIYFTTSIIVLIGVVLISVLYSHRVAGPVYRLELYARRIGEGDLSGRVVLRDKDVLHAVADDMNDLVAHYRKTVMDLEEKTNGLKEICSFAAGMAEEAFREDRERAVSKIEEKTNELRRIVDGLKV